MAYDGIGFTLTTQYVEVMKNGSMTINGLIGKWTFWSGLTINPPFEPFLRMEPSQRIQMDLKTTLWWTNIAIEHGHL